jgi:hypothetical protein
LLLFKRKTNSFDSDLFEEVMFTTREYIYEKELELHSEEPELHTETPKEIENEDENFEKDIGIKNEFHKKSLVYLLNSLNVSFPHK